MAWDTDLVMMVKALDGAIGAPPEYDEQLKYTIVAAGILVSKEIELARDYVFDISAPAISPDPVVEGDTVAQALLPLKAVCMLQQIDFRRALRQGIKVRDGDSMVDTSVTFRGYRDILEHGACAAYERLRWQIQASAASAVGAVLSPSRAPGEWAPDTITWFYDQLAASLWNHRTGR